MAFASEKSEVAVTPRDLRVLQVVPVDGAIKHGDVRPAARMDTSMCGLSLRRLRARGLIVATTRARGAGHGSGPPATFYTRTPLGCAVLAARTGATLARPA